LPPAGPQERVAYLTNGPNLLVIAGQRADTLHLLDLPAIPLRQLAGGFAVHAVPVPLGETGIQEEGDFWLFTGLVNSQIIGTNDLGTPLSGWPVSTGGAFA